MVFVLVNFFYGLFVGIILSFIVILVLDFVGSRLIGDGMGYFMLVCGVGCFIGLLVGGKIIFLYVDYGF